MLVLLAKPWRLRVSVAAAAPAFILSVKPFLFTLCSLCNRSLCALVSWLCNSYNNPILGAVVLVCVEYCSYELPWPELLHSFSDTPGSLAHYSTACLHHCLTVPPFLLSHHSDVSIIVHYMCFT